VQLKKAPSEIVMKSPKIMTPSLRQASNGSILGSKAPGSHLKENTAKLLQSKFSFSKPVMHPALGERPKNCLEVRRVVRPAPRHQPSLMDAFPRDPKPSSKPFSQPRETHTPRLSEQLEDIFLDDPLDRAPAPH
jgi:hypothetical protein